MHYGVEMGQVTRGQKSLKLSNSMTWSDQNCPTKCAYFAMIFLLKKCVKLCNIFMNSDLIFFGTIRLISQIMRSSESKGEQQE